MICPSQAANVTPPKKFDHFEYCCCTSLVHYGLCVYLPIRYYYVIWKNFIEKMCFGFQKKKNDSTLDAHGISSYCCRKKKPDSIVSGTNEENSPICTQTK